MRLPRLLAPCALALAAGCGSLPRVTIGIRGEPQPWDPALVGQFALEIETAVARAARQSEDQIVQHVATELEFGEEEVDPAAVLGGGEDLIYEIPSLEALRLDPAKVVGAIRARQLRAAALREWKQRGCIGERQNGKAVHVPCNAGRKDAVLADRLSFLVIKENRNRTHVYDTLLRANRWRSRRGQEIRAIFAAAIRDVAAPADLFQEGADWVAKDPDAATRERATAPPAPRRVRPLHRPESWEDADVLEPDGDAPRSRVVPQR